MLKCCWNGHRSVIGWSKHASTPNTASLPSFYESDKEDKEDWYEQLQQAVAEVPQHDMLLITGDMNAKVGAETLNCERAMGKHGCGVMNDNGERLVDFCLINNCVIGGTIFEHRDIYKLTMKSPDGRTSNQIDHIIINGKWRRSLQDVRVCCGDDIYSDHYLVTARIKLILQRLVPQESMPETTSVHKARMPSHQTGVCFGAEKPLQGISRHIRGVWPWNHQQMEHHQ